MALGSMEFFADSIQKMSGLNVILPEGDGPWPVLYLLHGLSDDHTVWCRRTSIERYAAELPLLIAMPDGHRSFYCNAPAPGGCAYEDHIVQDVVGFVERVFPTVAERRGRAIAGLSMGGYGAVMLALRHPEAFCAACSHSGALMFAHRPIPDRPDVDAFADALPAGEYDCFVLAEQRAADGRLPAIRIDCGTGDPLIEASRDFHAHLDALAIPHVYEEHPGEHTWEYWDRHIHRTLEFVMRAFEGT
jgi:putative tributyrin esterase